MTSCCSAKTTPLEVVQKHYASFIQSDHVKGNASGLEGLGYDAEFLALCGFKNEDDAEAASSSSLFFLEPSCGSGCPLRLLLLTEIDNGKPLLEPGSTVVDLGCGAGHDVILASGLLSTARQNDSNHGGHVIGIDATEEMLSVAEANVEKYVVSKAANSGVQIELIHDAFDSSIEELKMAGLLSPNIADVVISNGVFNMTRDKKAAFATAYWLLKPGGRLLLSDICRVNERPEAGAFFSPFESNDSSSDAGWSA